MVEKNSAIDVSNRSVRTGSGLVHEAYSDGDASGGRSVANTDGLETLSAKIRRVATIPRVLSGILLTAYAIAFVNSLQGRWFNRFWTTDDATQQTFPLYDALYPGRFENDLIAEVMRGCLPPVHYWMSFLTTLATKDPIMTGHWIMLLQVGLSISFLFLAVRKLSYNCAVPGFLAVLWLLHSRNTMQRMTGGLPRGWTPAIFGAFLYFAASKNHWGCMLTIVVASMLNPPGAMIIGVAYGFLLLYRFISSQGEERMCARKVLFQSIAFAPLFVLLALWVVQRPPHIGQMVSFSEASRMPEFQRPFGRFPFLPLRSVLSEYKIFGIQAFIGRLFRPPLFLREIMWWIVPLSLVGMACLGAVRKRIVLPAELLFFGLAASCTYLLSRLLAFRLFVPDRHLQIPMVFFLIGAFTVGIWRLCVKRDALGQKARVPIETLRSCWGALICFSGLGLIVFMCSGDGLNGDANFNYHHKKRGGMYAWLREQTPSDALVACHPTHCDGVQLFAARRALVTTETSQPFYPRYNLEMRRRSELSLRAQYATSLEEIVLLLAPEDVTHFVFRRSDFRPENLAKATYFPPLDRVVKEIASRSPEEFLFWSLPRTGLDKQNFPFVVFVDNSSIIIDIKALTIYLKNRGWSPPQDTVHASIERHKKRRVEGTVVVAGLREGNNASS